jgi:hypothetical protein
MRKSFKILIIISVVLFTVLLCTYLYLFPFGGLENIINNKLSTLVKPEYKLKINIGDITGSYFSGIVLKDVEIYYNDPDNSYRMITLPKLSTSYSFSNIWDARYVLDYLVLDSTEIEIRRDETGKWLIPDLKSDSTKEKPSITIPTFSIGSLELKNMKVTILNGTDTMSFHDILIEMGLSKQESSFALDLEKIEFLADNKIPVINAATGKITYDENNLLFKDFSLISGSSRVKLSGVANLEDTPSGQVDFTADNLNLDELTNFIGPKLKGNLDLNGQIVFNGANVDGNITLGGKLLFAELQNLYFKFNYNNKHLALDTLYGTIMGNCSIDGNGFIDFSPPIETYQIVADIRQFNLKNMLPNTFYSDLNGQMILNGESFRNKDLALNVDVNLYESQFDEYPMHKANGSMLITTDSISFADSFRVDYYDNIFYADGKIDYSNEMILNVTADLKDLDRYTEKIFIEKPGGRGFAKVVFNGNTSDPDLQGYFVSDSVWIYELFSDSMYAEVDIKRFFTGKKGQVEIDFYNGSAWDIPYDTGYTFLQIDSNMVYFDTASLKNRMALMTTNGSFDYEIYPNQLKIDSFYINMARQKFYNRGDINIEVDTFGFDFLQTSIGNNGQWILADGRINYDETMDMALSINKIPIAPWKNLYEDSVLVKGLLSCEATLSGTFMQPSFDMKAEIDQLFYEELILGDVNIDVSYNDQKLIIDTLLIHSNPGIYQADGSMYLDLAFTSDSLERFPDLPMDIHFIASDKRFDLISFLLPSVEIIEGDFNAGISLTGTPQNPHLEGDAFIKSYESVDDNGKKKQAYLKYFDLEDRIYFDSVGITMSDNFVHLDSITFYLLDNKKKRYGYFDGDITIKSIENFHYNVDCIIPQPIPFSYELDDIYGKLVGSFHVEGDTPPLVTGDIEIIEMKYLVQFAEPYEGSPIMRLLVGENTWDLDINVDFGSNYWIKNEDIDAEFSGEMKIERYEGLYTFSGQLEILRGKGYLFDKTIRLDQGGTVIFEGDDRFDPSLDITGYTRITAAPDRTQEVTTTEQLTLGLHISGTLEEPQINVTEDSDFSSNSDIIPALVANYGGSTEVSSIFEQSMTNLLSAQMSQIGTRQLSSIGVETFELDPYYQGQFNPLATRLTLGFYTSSNLYIYGRSALSGQSRQEVGFEYRWKKWVLIQGLRDEEELYHLNLHLNWEF